MRVITGGNLIREGYNPISRYRLKIRHKTVLLVSETATHTYNNTRQIRGRSQRSDSRGPQWKTSWNIENLFSFLFLACTVSNF